MAMMQEPPPDDWVRVLGQLLGHMQRRRQQQPQGEEGQQQQQQPWPQFQQRQQLPVEDLQKLIQGQLNLGQQGLEMYSPMAQAKAARYLDDPYGSAVANRDAEMATHSGIDWFKQANKIPELTPEAALGMQGNSAANQWAQLGAYKGVNPEDVKRMTVNRRFPA
jgi:hypothetical protein